MRVQAAGPPLPALTSRCRPLRQTVAPDLHPVPNLRIWECRVVSGAAVVRARV